MPDSIRVVSLVDGTEETADLPGPAERVGRAFRAVVETGGVLDLPAPLLLPEEGFDMPTHITPEIPPLALARFEDAVFDAASGMVLPSADRVLFDPVTMWPLNLNGVTLGGTVGGGGRGAEYRVDPGAARPLAGAHVVLGLTRADYLANWYHWLIEHLPKLYLLTRLSVARSLPILMVPPVTAAQRQSLDALGVNADRCVMVPAGTAPVRPEVAYVPGPIGVHSAVSPTAVGWMADTVIDRLGLRDIAGSPLLYVERHGFQRAIADEEALTTVLAASEFRILRPDRMDFADQVRAYRGARVVVSAHGAGLANIAFCRPGTVVVELTSLAHGERPSLNMIYANLAAIRGLRHVFAVGRAVDAAGNFTIDPAKVVRAAMLGLREVGEGAVASTRR